MKNLFLSLLFAAATFTNAQQENPLGGIIKNSNGDNVKFVCENNDNEPSQHCKIAVSIEVNGIKSYISNSRILTVYNDYSNPMRVYKVSTRELIILLDNGNTIIRNRKLGPWSQNYIRKIADCVSNPAAGLNEPGAWIAYPMLPFIIPITAAFIAAEGVLAPIYLSIRDGITVLGQPSKQRGFKNKKLYSILNFLSLNSNQVKILSDRHFNRLIYLLSKMNY